MKYIIRKRERKDCKGIARVVTISWNETYKGIVSDNELDMLVNNEESRAKKSYDEFDINNNRSFSCKIPKSPCCASLG